MVPEVFNIYIYIVTPCLQHSVSCLYMYMQPFKQVEIGEDDLIMCAHKIFTRTHNIITREPCPRSVADPEEAQGFCPPFLNTCIL